MNWYKKLVFAARSFTQRELVNRLKNWGVVYLREGKGSHKIYGIPDTNRGASIPSNISGKPIKTKTMMDILRNLEIPYQEFIRGKPAKQIEEETKEVEQLLEKKTPDWQNQPWYQQQQQYEKTPVQ
tara:strand:+ start:6088 stop:6465 length:378 start_codon:yes stop_codon:yes gene_type:complete